MNLMLSSVDSNIIRVYSTVLNKRRGANKRRGLKNEVNLINKGVQKNVGR